MTNSINTNIAAFYAQANITQASNAASSSVARLSSGNRIVQASDDVAGLATGTSLQTQVSALKTAQTNASQGTSLLQVADGALAQIQSILQTQQSIALQAGSGSLTDTDRGFLNQEFQALTNEINSLAGSTTFNGVSLLDGSLSATTAVTTNTNTGASSAKVSSGILNNTATTDFAAGDKVIINGFTVTFATSPTAGEVTVGSTHANTIKNLAAFLNEQASPKLAGLTFAPDGGTATQLDAHWAGGSLNGSITITTTLGSGNTGQEALVGAGTATITSTGTLDGLGVDRTVATGTVTSSVLETGSSTADASSVGAPIDTANVKGNADFVGGFGTGNIGTFSATYNSTDHATFKIVVGDITYTSANTVISSAAAAAGISVTMTGKDALGNLAGGTFALNIAGNAAIAVNSIASQSSLDSVVNQINSDLSPVTFLQNRDVSSFSNTGSNIVTVNGSEAAILTGTTANLTTSSFTAANTNISGITITAPITGSTDTDAVITATVGGDTYTSQAGIGNQIGINKQIVLVDSKDSTKTLTLVTGSSGLPGAATTAWDLSTQANASAVATALKTAFGINAGLTFQLGTTSSSAVSVNIDSAETTSLYGGLALDVSTQAGAEAANTQVTAALNSVTAIRSSVGALESQFNFASAALQTSVQNQTAAASQFLDTDIASESTSYATDQVKLQAGISVLAQANQQLQALLKLIG